MQISAKQIDQLLQSVFAAGRLILDVRRQGAKAVVKGDGSPVTIADQGAEDILLHALAERFPHIPVIAEEAADAGQLPDVTDVFFLVDPLDGTKEFIRGGTDFTVNIGLIKDKKPVFGIVYAPASGQLFVGDGLTAWRALVDCTQETPQITQKQSIKVRRPDPNHVQAVASRSHRDAQTDRWLSKRGISDIVSAGSSIKFCLIAMGKADVYPRFGPTMQWDTAAAHAVLCGAGGTVCTLDGDPFVYGPRPQEKAYLNTGFIAWGDQF